MDELKALLADRKTKQEIDPGPLSAAQVALIDARIMACVQEQLWQQWRLEELLADRKARHWDVAKVYALLVGAERLGAIVDWKDINAQLQQRWPKGLVRVKRMAWRIVEGKVRA